MVRRGGNYLEYILRFFPQEFVAHIKALHKDMVDEAVLNSLESDLKKRKKKEVIKGEKTEKQKVKEGKKLPTPAKPQPIR